MLMTIITLLAALSISVIAIYYSVAGLAAIFAAAVVPIIIMGVALEIGKLVTAVWLHKYWKIATWWLKTYLSLAVVVLMFITSMGIFGFLSKAHMDQTLVSGDSQSQVAMYDEKIKTERDNIDASRRALAQMDAQVNEVLGRSDDTNGAERAVQIRRQQARERTTLQNEIAQSQENISKLQEERAPLAAEVRKIEAEVGPIKYIAEFIYGAETDQNMLEAAVRWVIVILIFVFDPLAVLLLIASQYTWEYHRKEKQERLAKRKEEEAEEKFKETFLANKGVVPQELDLGVTEEPEQVDAPVIELVEQKEETPPVAVELASEEQLELPFTAESKVETLEEPVVVIAPELEVASLQEEAVVSEPEDPSKKKVLEYSEELEEPVNPVTREEEYIKKELNPSFQNAKMAWKEQHPDQTLKLWKNLYIQGKIDKLPWEEPTTYEQNAEQGENSLFNKLRRND